MKDTQVSARGTLMAEVSIPLLEPMLPFIVHDEPLLFIASCFPGLLVKSPHGDFDYDNQLDKVLFSDQHGCVSGTYMIHMWALPETSTLRLNAEPLLVSHICTRMMCENSHVVAAAGARH